MKKISDNKKSKSITNPTKIVAIFFWIIIFILFQHYKSSNNLTTQGLGIQIFNTFTGSYIGAILYIITYTIRPLTFFPGSLLTIASGSVFGLWQGIFLTIIASNLSSSFAFFIGRFFGNNILKGNNHSTLSQWQKKLKENGFISVLIMRLIYLPYDLVNYGSGILKVKWKDFFFGTFLGTLPGTISFVSFGSSIENIENFNPESISINRTQLLISLIMFFLSLYLAKLIKKKTHK